MNMKVNTCCIISFKFTFSLNNSIEEIDISGSRGNVSVVIALHPFAYPSSFLVQVYKIWQAFVCSKVHVLLIRLIIRVTSFNLCNCHCRTTCLICCSTMDNCSM